MAFSKVLFDPTSSGSKGGQCAAYGTIDTKAVVKAAGYFNSVANELTGAIKISIKASDATFDAKVDVAAGVVTLSAMDAF